MELSKEEAEAKLAEIESQIADIEHSGAVATKQFIDLLHQKIELCRELKRFNEVNNTEMRIRFLEARMRGEVTAHAEMIDLERLQRRKRRNRSNTLLLMTTALFVVVLGSVPVVYQAMKLKQSSGDSEAGYGPDMNTVVLPDRTEPTTTSHRSGAAKELNTENPGQEFDLRPFLKPKQTTYVYFHSEYCPPCKALMPRYEMLAMKAKPDTRFYTIDVNRPGVEGIDFMSPLARQFQISAIPFILVFDGENLVASGEEGVYKVIELINKQSPADMDTEQNSEN